MPAAIPPIFTQSIPSPFSGGVVTGGASVGKEVVGATGGDEVGGGVVHGGCGIIKKTVNCPLRLSKITL